MIYKGSQKEGKVYIGGTKIGKIYKGGTLVYSSGLPSGTVIFESATPGTYTVNITSSQTYYIELVGGGGNGYYASGAMAVIACASGGSGGYVYGNINISTGSYSIVVGSNQQNSSAFNQIAGAGGTASVQTPGTGGTCSTTLNYINGNNGGQTRTDGGASVHNGYGVGGASRDSNTNGGNGYCKIVVA